MSANETLTETRSLSYVMAFNEAVRQGLDEPVRVRRVRRRTHALLRRRFGPGRDIRADALAEQDRLLSHHADLSAQARKGRVPDVHAIDRNSPRFHVVEAR